MEVPTDDRSHFRRKAILVPMVGVDTELEIGAVEECPIVGVRHGKQRAQFESVEPAVPVLAGAIQRHVQSRFEPPGDAPRPLGHAVEGLVGDERARKRGRVGADGREVVMPREVELALLGQPPVIHLDLVRLRAQHPDVDHANEHEYEQQEPPRQRRETPFNQALAFQVVHTYARARFLTLASGRASMR